MVRDCISAQSRECSLNLFRHLFTKALSADKKGTTMIEIKHLCKVLKQTAGIRGTEGYKSAYP